MQEIEFRGKRIVDNKWVYGSLIVREQLGDNKKYYTILTRDNEGWTSAYKEEIIYKNTIGQYTGRKDKNGKKIFCGDILMDLAGGIYTVVYNTQYICFAFEQDNIKFGLENFDSIKDFKVIGNVFDNPELLEVNNDK